MFIEEADGLYPEIEPYLTGFLPVGHGHELYYELSGNPEGRPVIVIHGGPGGGCENDDRRLFDPKKWKIVMYDQRGCGQSKPFGLIEYNSTRYLIKDINRLVKFLDLEKVVLCGASWGSTLALVYAIKYPNTVAGMIIGGIYLGTKEENVYFNEGSAGIYFFPEAWDRFISQVPDTERHNPTKYYHRMMTIGDENSRRTWAYEWARYEIALSNLNSMSEEEIEKEVNSFPYEAMGILESHYFRHNSWLRDGYILNNIGQALAEIPTVIIQGRYDMICPPLWACRLGRALPQAKLNLVVGGHDCSDPENCTIWVNEVNDLWEKLNTR